MRSPSPSLLWALALILPLATRAQAEDSRPFGPGEVLDYALSFGPFNVPGTGRAEVRRALAMVGSVTPPFDGVTGTVSFDANGDVPNQNVYIGQVQHGAVTVLDGAEETVVGSR